MFNYAQTDKLNTVISLENVKLKDFSVSVTVDSAEDIESTFKVTDLKEILNEVSDNESVKFEIICNGDLMSNGEKSTLSYKVNGNTKDIDAFLESVNKIRNAAINYYKNR
jgi:hypothetical protein